MRALITGAAGFAGRYTAAELLRRGVVTTGTDVPSAPPPPGLTWVPADLTRPDEALRAVEAAAPDAVLHLAGQPRVGASFDDPTGTIRANTGTTVNMLEAVRRAAPAARLLLVSSCEIYGEVQPDRLPIREETPPAPASPYAASKAAAELFARAWAHTHGLRVAILRPFNHTGPGQSPHFVCADFARQVAWAETGRHPPVISTGRLSIIRDFLDVRDVAAAYADALAADLPPGACFNIASGRGVALREILDIFLALARRPLQTHEDPARHRAADIAALVGDAARFRERTGWAPRIALRQTLADLLDHARAAR